MSRYLALTCLLAALAGSAQAQSQCYADYKAKQDKPLRLHYGVAEVSACNRATAENELDRRLNSKGWTLLQVMDIFGADGLDQRKESAGQYYLRF